MAIFDMKQIHPGIAPSGALHPRFIWRRESEDRLAELHQFMDQRAPDEITHPPRTSTKECENCSIGSESLVVSLARTVYC